LKNKDLKFQDKKKIKKKGYKVEKFKLAHTHED